MFTSGVFVIFVSLIAITWGLEDSCDKYSQRLSKFFCNKRILRWIRNITLALPFRNGELWFVYLHGLVF